MKDRDEVDLLVIIGTSLKVGGAQYFYTDIRLKQMNSQVAPVSEIVGKLEAWFVVHLGGADLCA